MESNSETLPNDASDSGSVARVLGVLQSESEALGNAARFLAQQRNHLQCALEQLLDCRGRVIVTGMGKMSCIARKAAATFCSTGTPAVFLHAGEAAHGDLGIVTPQDVLMLLSHSGETREVLGLLPFAARTDVPSIAIVGDRESSLGQRCGAVLETGVKEEADTIAVTPTNSTTVTLAICDALAVALMDARGFTAEQFAIFHPGGYLGSKLLTLVSDLMHTGERRPIAHPNDPLGHGIKIISEKKFGAVFVVDPVGQLIGVLTDGDLRRLIERVSREEPRNVMQDSLSKHMTQAPQRIAETALAAEALRLLEEHGITVLPVVDADQQVTGVLHLHDLVRAGLA